MKSEKRRVPAAIALAVVLTSCAVFTGVSLSVVSKPPAFSDRLATLTARTAAAERLMRRGAVGGSQEPQGVCAHGAPAQIQALKDEINGYATQFQMQPTTIEARLGAGGDPRVTPLTVRFEVTGSYADAMAMLGALSKRRPTVFADTVDLTSRTSNVTLSFSGRVFCVA